jgi:hypothetical protein
LRLNNAGAGGFDGGAGGRDLGFADSSAARALSAAARSSSSCWAETAPRCERAGADVAFRRGVQLRLPLLHHRFAGAHFTLPLIEQGSGGGTALSASLICAAASRRCSFSTRVSILASTLPGAQTALFDQNGVDTPGDFGGNIDFGGFDSAVAAGKPSGSPGGRSSHHAAAASTTSKPTKYPAQRFFILSIRDSLDSLAEWCACFLRRRSVLLRGTKRWGKAADAALCRVDAQPIAVLLMWSSSAILALMKHA